MSYRGRPSFSTIHNDSPETDAKDNDVNNIAKGEKRSKCSCHLVY